MKYDLTVVGYVVLDYISRGGRTTGPLLGGPSIYASLAARALNASVAVVSKVGPDFGEERFKWLRKQGLATTHILTCDSLTTSFKIRYRNGDRTMKVDPVCDRIKAADLSPSLVSSSIHVGPVLREVPLSLALCLRDRADIMSVDPQGYVRTRLQSGTVKKSIWRNSSAMLRKTDVLKVSENEMPGILGNPSSARKLFKLGPRIILLTRGEKGVSVLSRDEGEFFLPAYKTRVKDPTGAGDALAGAFLVSWNKTRELLWSAALGAAVASFVVEEPGPAYFGTSRQINARAERIMQRTMKIAA